MATITYPGEHTAINIKKMPRKTAQVFHSAERDVLSKFQTIFVLGILMLFVAGVSYFGLLHQSLRLDEAQSLWQSSHSTGMILKIIGQDVHVPLYALILHFWEVLFGNNITNARLLSLVFFLASIPAMYWLGKTAYNKSAGIIGAVLVATSPFLNWYGNETRMYSLFTLVAILNQGIFLKIFQARQRNENEQHLEMYWLLYALTALLGMYTHYFFGLVLLVQAIFFLAHRAEFPAKSLRNFILTAVFLAACFAPWLYYVTNLGSASNTQPFIARPTTVNLFNTFSQFLFGFQDDHLNTILVSLWPLTVLLGFLSLSKRKKIPAESIYFFLSAILPILIAFAISITVKPLFLTRYLIIAAPSLYLFLVWLIQTYAKKLRVAVTAVIIVVMVVTLGIQTTSAQSPVKENYKQASDFLTSSAKPQDIIAISAPFTVYPLEYYYSGSAEITTLPIWDRFIVGPIPPYSDETLPAQVDKIKDGHERVYLVLSYDQGYEQKIKYYFDTHFQKIEEKNFSHDLNVYVYRVNSPVTFDSIINAHNPYSTSLQITTQ